MKIALTGARGFVGWYVLDKLLKEGCSIRALSRRSSNELSHNRLTWVIGDLRDESALNNLLQDVEVVCHLAGVIEGQNHHEVNFEFTKKLFQLAKISGVRHFIHLSSVGVYGKQEDGCISEDTNLSAENNYEKSKMLADEFLLHECANKIAISILRPSIVFGSDMPNQSLRQLMNMIGRRFFFFIGRPGAIAPYVHVENVANAIWLLANRGGRKTPQVYNLSDHVTMEDFIQCISNSLGIRRYFIRIPRICAKLLVDITSFMKISLPLTHARIHNMSSRAIYDSRKFVEEFRYEFNPTICEGLEQCVNTWFPILSKELKHVKIARVSHIAFFLVSQLKSQINYLCRNGMNIMLISSDGEALNALETPLRAKHQVIYIHREMAPWQDLISLWQLFRYFRKSKPVIVHSTTPKAGLLCAVAGFMAGVPIRLHTFTGQVWVNMKGMSRRIAIFCDKLIIYLNTQVYADSWSQVEFLKSEKVISSIFRVPVLGKGSLAGVDLERFNKGKLDNFRKSIREDLRIAKDSKVVAFFGRVTKDKGIEELVRAFILTNRNVPNSDMIVMGPLENERNPLSQDVVQLLNTHARIHFRGYDPNPERYMVAADILCIPSYREGFGTVVIEAAALGLPTLGTKVQGLVDSVVDGETGLLVPPKDIPNLTDAMTKLLIDDQLRQRLGNNAILRAKKYFDVDFIGKLNSDEYAKYLHRRGF